MTVEDRLLAEIRRRGPLRFDEVLEAALYDPDGGFYAGGGGRAGRRGDFLTSPEIGPLFGAVLGRALDTWWDELGRPDPFVVVEAGAGPGTLARSVLAAGPRCGPALRYVLVERSAPQRALHHEHLPLVPASHVLGDGTETGDGPVAVSMADLPRLRLRGAVIIANELLDDLPFRLLQRAADGWQEVRAGATGDDAPLAEVLVAAPHELVATADRLAPRAVAGARIPLQEAGADWLRSALEVLERGRLVVIDYAVATTSELADRPWTDWARTYRGHERGGHPLVRPGSQDVTCEVAVDQLARVRAPDLDRSQPEFLRAHGLDDLVAEGRQVWAERAHLGDLAAVRARSRVTEAAALTDPSSFGTFRALEWVVGGSLHAE